MRYGYLSLAIAAVATLLWLPVLAAVPAQNPIRHCELQPGAEAGDPAFYCDDGPLTPPVVTRGFIALALGDKDGVGMGWNVSLDQARATAIKYCRDYGGTACHIVDTRQGTCLAVAESLPQGIRVWEAQLDRYEGAGDRAADDCRKSGGTACKVTVAGCSDGQSDSYISLAVSSTHLHALGWGNALADADAAALKSCSENKTPKCEIVQRATRTCIAVAGSRKDNITFTASGWNIAQTRAAAIQDCRAAGGKSCSSFLDGCSDGDPPAPDTDPWSVPAPLILMGLANLGGWAFVLYKLVGVRITPVRAFAKPAELPVSFATSRIKMGMFVMISVLIFVPITELLL